MIRRSTVLLLLFFSAYCLPSIAQNYIGNARQIDRILATANSFSELLVAGDIDGLVDIYAVDAKIFPGNEEIISGREAIRDFWQLSEDSRIVYHRVMPEEIKITGKEAYDFGYYEGRTRNAAGEEFFWRGKYVIIWRKTRDGWKMYLDIWNRVKDE